MTDRLKRLAPAVIAADRELLRALQNLPSYQPINPSYSLAAMQQQEASLTQAELTLIRLEQELKQVRAMMIDLSHALHATGLGVKNQVVAQYGAESTEFKIVDSTRAATRKRAAKRAAAALARADQ